MKQPLAGISSTIIICALALGFISLFSFGTFSGWVAYLIDCVIPVQVVIGVTLGSNHPAFAASKAQPLKGLLLLLCSLVMGGILAAIFYPTIGHSINPPTPILIFFMINLVLTTFLLTIMWGGWPFVGWIKSPLVGGFAVLVASVVLGYILFRAFHDFSFMRGAPFFRESDPHGIFNAWSFVVYYVTVIAAMFLIAAFDLWPLHLNPSLMKQPVLGVAWTLLSAVIAYIADYIAIDLLKMDVVSFMVTVPIPFIFGTIIVLNMLQGSLFSNLKPPLKGVCNVVVIALVGGLLARIYLMLMPTLSGALKPGAPGFDQEIWLASALLSVTFPTLVCFAEFFKLWPLRKAQ
jgi:hypothetical protein